MDWGGLQHLLFRLIGYIQLFSLSWCVSRVNLNDLFRYKWSISYLAAVGTIVPTFLTDTSVWWLFHLLRIAINYLLTMQFKFWECWSKPRPVNLLKCYHRWGVFNDSYTGYVMIRKLTTVLWWRFFIVNISDKFIILLKWHLKNISIDFESGTHLRFALLQWYASLFPHSGIFKTHFSPWLQCF
jgi:hypothetical protein